MICGNLIILAMAVFGASAHIMGGCNVGYTGLNAGFGSTVGTSPIIENVPIRIPGFVHPTTVQDNCNCIKTVVRPQIRKEVFTIPSVQRFIQTTSTPIVETIPYVSGTSVDVPAVGGIASGFGIEAGLGVGYGINNAIGGVLGAGCGAVY